MSDPCPAPPGFAWVRVPLGCPGDAWALSDAAGLRLLLVHYADGWTLCDGAGTILRDAVTDGRLPDAIEAAITPNPKTQE